MILDTLIIADAVYVGPEGKFFAHGGGITRLNPPTLPYAIPQLAVLVRFEIDDDDIGRSFDIEYVLSGPGGEILRAQAPVTVVTPDLAPGEEFFLSGSLTINGPPLTAPGLHTLAVLIEGKEMGKATLVVVEPPPSD